MVNPYYIKVSIYTGHSQPVWIETKHSYWIMVRTAMVAKGMEGENNLENEIDRHW